MNRKSCSCACRAFVLGAATLVIPICMATAPPYSDANLPGYSPFGKEWAILSNDIFFGGPNVLFGLSPATRNFRWVVRSNSETASRTNAIVTETSRDDDSSVALPFSLSFGLARNGTSVPNVITAIKQFDANATSSTTWGTAVNWAPDGVPTSAEDVVFDNVFRSTLQNVQLSGSGNNFPANSITLNLTTNQIWGLGASSGTTNATLTLTTGNITRNNTTNNSLNIIGAQNLSANGIIGSGVLTLATPASGFTITNLDTTGNLQINAVISGATKTMTTLGPGTTIFSGANTYTGTTTVSSGTLLVNGNQMGATGAVTVSNAGTLLGGTGIIGGSVTLNTDASITGGTNGSVGTLTLTSNLTFTFGNYAADLSGTAADLLAIGGILDLSSGLDELTLNGTPDGTSSYTLATYMSVTGQFDFDNVPTNYQLIYGDTSLILAPIPEPATWISAALALAAIGFTQRRPLRSVLSPRKRFTED